MKPEHKKYILENINKKSIKELAWDLGLKERKVRKFIEVEKQKKKPADFKAEIKPPARPVKKTTLLTSIALIIILGLAVYANSLNGKFLYDDDELINNNPYIKQWSYLNKVFTENIASGVQIKSNFYRPIQLITYMIDFSLWKLNPLGYHLTSIILHILAALCIYWFVQILFKDQTLSLLASIIFVIHPVHTVVVSYISTRADLLALLFTLLSFIFYLRILRTDKIILYIPMVFSYALALLSKENSLILPVLILLYHFSFKEKIKLKAFFSLLGIVFIYVLLRTTLLKLLLSNVSYPTTLLQRLPGFFVALTNYIRLLFLPFDLHSEYGLHLFKFTHPQAILGIVITAVVLSYILKVRNTNRFFFFATSWFAITLLPQSNLYPINAYMSENWLYLPSIGFLVILAKGLSLLYKKAGFRIFTLLFMIGLITFYSYLTIEQNNYWREPIAFYERTLRYAPDSAKAYNNLGLCYSAIGRKEEALTLYKKAVELDPNFLAYNNLGISYSQIGKNEEAIAAYNKAIELNPNYARAYNNLGVCYYNIGRKEEAIELYKKTIELNPNFVEAYYNLGISYSDIGKKEEAIASYKKAIELNPNYAKAYHNLGISYSQIGKNEEAITAYKKAIELDPNYAEAYINLGGAYYTSGKIEEAIAAYKKAIELTPNEVIIYNNLGIVYDSIGKIEEAAAAYKKARELNPNYVEPLHEQGAQ